MMFKRGHRPPPGDVVLTDIQPLGVLVEHGVHYMGKGLIGVEEAVAASE